MKNRKTAPVSVSLFRKRWRKFKGLKRGYYSFIILITLYALSFALPLLVNNRAILVKYQGNYYFPVLKHYPGSVFGEGTRGEVEYRELRAKFRERNGEDFVIMPPYPYGSYESLLDISREPPHPPSLTHWFGTDDRGRDVFARMAYGFNISITFALLLTLINYTVGVVIGALLGYYGGKLDIFGQRFIEIWSALPFLYTVIIVASILRPNFLLLVFVLCLTGWVGMTYYMRGEFYRERAKDYVAAAVATGASDRRIIIRHILPNALTPVIAFFPFSIVGGIGYLVSLDYLGFGLPPPTPSWGQMVRVGMESIFDWWLVLAPLGALFCTLLLVVFIGEAIREAFDPRVYSRLR